MAWTLLAAGMMFFINEEHKVLRTGLIAFFIYLVSLPSSIHPRPVSLTVLPSPCVPLSMFFPFNVQYSLLKFVTSQIHRNFNFRVIDQSDSC
jgi:hypothetical protein